MTVNNYVLGRGSLFFTPFLPGTTTPAVGEVFFGDCNVVDFSFKSTEVDHYSSTGGIKEIDASIPSQIDRSGTFTTENINSANLALFFLGSTSQLVTAGATISAEVITGVLPDRYYQLGETATNPSGNRDISMVSGSLPVVTNGLTAGALVTYVAGTDYIIDPASGSLYTVPGGAITTGNLSVTYTILGQTRDQIVSGNKPIFGKLRFRSANAAGANHDAVVPYVGITPNGSFALVGDKLTALQFNMKILRKGGIGGEALYIDGRGVVGG